MYNLAMPTALTLAITKTALKLSQGLGRGGGTALPGLIAEKLDPHLAGKLAAGLPHGVILVTGTNGKTTTTKMIAAMLEASGERVLTNRAGSNLKRGIVSALIAQADWRGRTKATIGLLEVDEASLRRIAPEVQPTQIVVTNLFRDQLDRYGELDTTAALLGQGIAATSAHVYLNADDPLVASLAKYALPERVSYFGIEGLPVAAATTQATAADSDRCPVCSTRLIFSRTYYGHIGHYRCPKGDFTRPQPHIAITSVDQMDLAGTHFTVAIQGKRYAMSLPLPGTYNLYNALAALSLASGLGLSADTAEHSLARTGAAFGRVEEVELDGRKLYLLLIKNPAGFTQVLETFLLGHKHLRALMIINDNHADGRDVSWLWDVPLELLPASAHIWTAGSRGADMALRLHYAGLKPNSTSSVEQALAQLVEQTPVGGTAFILPTYTAMLELRKLLAKRTEIEEVWK